MIELPNFHISSPRVARFCAGLAGVGAGTVILGALVGTGVGGGGAGLPGQAERCLALTQRSSLGSALSRGLAGPMAGIDSLAAAPVLGDDYDGDGLSDAQEQVLGTSMYAEDSDGDGFPDAEEFARQSDPSDFHSVPRLQDASASLSARGEGGDLRLVISVYEPAGTVGEAMLRLGALAGGQVLSVPIGRFLGLADIQHITGPEGSLVTVIDLPINPAFVQVHGQVTFFLAAGSWTTMQVGSAAKIDISTEAGELVLQRPVQANLSNHASQGGGSIRRPIPVGGNAPSPLNGWVPGAICFQRSEVVGVNGSRMLHQIVEADCLEGWDTFCSRSCSGAVGSTYETIDPLGLLGS